jgi:phosphoglycolate phosphatase-like HAD superfamily hydrolase
MKLHPCLHQIDTILFDMDGVVTSERGYWDAAALTVAEFLFQPAALPEARRWLPEAVIGQVKGRAVSTNWDLAYLVAGAHVLAVRPPGPIQDGQTVRDWMKHADPVPTEKAMEFFFRRAGEASGYALLERMQRFLAENACLEAAATQRSGLFWTHLWERFQLWYLGSERYGRTYGKTAEPPGMAGILDGEELLLPEDRLRRLFSTLSNAGLVLAVATGRCRQELEIPLRRAGLWDYLDPDRIVTHDEVAAAERDLPGTALSKPHPFPFLKALHPACSLAQLVSHDYDDLPHGRALVVGDTVGDIKAARDAGCRCAAVLTGVEGLAAQLRLRDAGADWILDDVLALAPENGA